MPQGSAPGWVKSSTEWLAWSTRDWRLVCLDGKVEQCSVGMKGNSTEVAYYVTRVIVTIAPFFKQAVHSGYVISGSHSYLSYSPFFTQIHMGGINKTCNYLRSSWDIVGLVWSRRECGNWVLWYSSLHWSDCFETRSRHEISPILDIGPRL